MKRSQIKLIYNPLAGKKRRFFKPAKNISIEEITSLLEQYELAVDLAPTKGPGHATVLAKEAKEQGYKLVIAAGGDGTISEVANGLIDTDIPLGIIPLGSFMNIAKMLSIPANIESAVILLKLGRMRKIDVGMITQLGEGELKKPHFFIETSGVGLEAHLHQEVREIERGHFGEIFHLLKDIYNFRRQKITLQTDHGEISYRAHLVSVTNGPLGGAGLKIAPTAKLNDHRLTVVVYKMKKWNLLKYFGNLFFDRKVNKRALDTIKTKTLTIQASPNMLVHADATLFDFTPVSYEIKPSALSVITGFPKASEDFGLIKRTYVRP